MMIQYYHQFKYFRDLIKQWEDWLMKYENEISNTESNEMVGMWDKVSYGKGKSSKVPEGDYMHYTVIQRVNEMI